MQNQERELITGLFGRLQPFESQPRDAEADALIRDLAARAAAGQLPERWAELYIADTVNELGLFYRLSQVAYLGGSLVPMIGGHNPIEPAKLGCALLAPFCTDKGKRQMRRIERGDCDVPPTTGRKG